MQGLWQDDSPFFPQGMTIGRTATGTHGRRFNCSSLAIVELILDTLPACGTPAKVLFTSLQASFPLSPTDLKHWSLSFSVNPDDIKSHQDEVEKIVNELNRSELQL